MCSILKGICTPSVTCSCRLPQNTVAESCCRVPPQSTEFAVTGPCNRSHHSSSTLPSSSSTLFDALKLKYIVQLQISDSPCRRPGCNRINSQALKRCERSSLITAWSISGQSNAWEPCSARITSMTASAILSKLKLVFSSSLHHPSANNLVTISVRHCPDGVSSLASAS